MTTTQITAELAAIRPRVDRPCPDWCDREYGHPWEDGTDGYVTRCHSRTFSPEGEAIVAVIADETAPQVPCDCPTFSEEIADLAREANQLVGLTDAQRRSEFDRRKHKLLIGKVGCDCPFVASGPSTHDTPVVQVDPSDGDLEPDEATRLATLLRQAGIACARYRSGEVR